MVEDKSDWYHVLETPDGGTLTTKLAPEDDRPAGGHVIKAVSHVDAAKKSELIEKVLKKARAARVLGAKVADEGDNNSS